MTRRNPTPELQRVVFPGDGDARGTAEALMEAYENTEARALIAREEARARVPANRRAAWDGMGSIDTTRNKLTIEDMHLFAGLVAACYEALPEEVPAKKLFIEVRALARSEAMDDAASDSVVLSRTKPAGAGANVGNRAARDAKPLIHFSLPIFMPGWGRGTPGIVRMHYDVVPPHQRDELESASWRAVEVREQEEVHSVIGGVQPPRLRERVRIFHLPPTWIESQYDLMLAGDNPPDASLQQILENQDAVETAVGPFNDAVPYFFRWREDYRR